MNLLAGQAPCRPPKIYQFPRAILSSTLLVLLSVSQATWAANNLRMGVSNIYSTAPSPINAERLSDWLQRQPSAENAYFSGLSWLVPAEVPAQAIMQSALKSHLIGSEWTYRADLKARQRLSAWLGGLPVTGRVPVEQSDARWLEAHPAQNPVLAPDHRVVVPLRPSSVTVVGSNGLLCISPHIPGQEALAYLVACKGSSQSRRVERVWIAQPDGRTQTFGVAGWNAQAQGEPAPGAWIWGPSKDEGWSDEFGKILIEFLATQGPSGGAEKEAVPADVNNQLTSIPPLGLKAALRDTVHSANDWGGLGLLQNPTARMAKAGEFSINFSRNYPYSRANVTLQPLDWLELTYRYTSISEVLYGPTDLSGNQSYKDKSVDLKIRLMQESSWLPDVSVGGRDIAGTGLFSGEFLVASKRTGNFDWSLGLGWGSLGAKSTLANPLSFISNKFNVRGGPVGGGGQFAFGSFFRGRTSLFGGVEYQTGWDPLVLKLEYDSNDYKFAKQFEIPAPKSSFNMGAVYRYSPFIDVTLGLQRGNVATLGVALHYPLSQLSTPKINDPPSPRFIPERPVVANWSSTTTDLKAQTGWQILEIRKQGSVLQIELENADSVYWRDMVDRATAILHRDAPADVEEFHFLYKTRGIAMANHVVSRERWAKTKTQPLLPSELIAQRYSLLNQYAMADANGDKSTIGSVSVLSPKRSPLTGDIGYNLQQSLGGPDGFILYQVSVNGGAELQLTPTTWLSSSVSVRALDNYKKFLYTAPSLLPRVRTFIREYVTTARVTMSNLQLTHAGQLSRNQYYSVYGGYLESMYAGVGGEWLYRPLSGPLALGVDINSVKQRNFDQKFGLRDYRTVTGHATAYIETGWNGVIAKVSVGQYLAKDRGVTLDLSRRFSNGVVFGAFVTKTNVSAVQFGEGSFDKGIYFSIPLGALLTRSTPEISVFNWNPLTRDGGAKLRRGFPLYNMTSLRDPRTLTITPPDGS